MAENKAVLILSHKDFKADGTVATFVVIALKVNLFKIKVCKFFS